MITGLQIRAARALLRWSAKDLAGKCGVSYASVQRAEMIDGIPNMQAKNLISIQSALTQAGVDFVPGGVLKGESE